MAIRPIEILINARDNASSVFDSLGNKLKVLGAAAVGYFGIKTFAGAVQGAADFEQALSRVQSATGGSAEEMERLKKAAQDAGANTKYTSTEAAAALENLAKAGLSAGDAIETLPAVLALAQAGDIELATASEYVTKAVMGMGLAFTDAGRVADVLALGANATNTSVEGLAQALSYAAPTAKSLGVSLESTVAIIGKFADAGIDASRAGTALNSIMSQFSDPASKFRKELGAIGITTGDFEKALKQLAESGARGSQAINAVGLEAGPALKALLNQGMPALDALKEKLNGAAGSAAATAKVMQNNLNGALGVFENTWRSVKDTLGESVLPVLQGSVESLTAAFKNAVADGTVAKFGEAIAASFQAGIKWAKAFLAEIDFTALAASLRVFADRTGEAFTQLGEYATNAGNIVKTVYGVIAAGTNAVLGAVYGIGEAFAGVASNIQSGVALLYDAFAKITFGNVSAAYKQAADEIRLSADATMAAAEELGKKSTTAFLATADGAQLARDGFTGLAQTVSGVAPAIDAAAAAQAQANKEMEAGAAAAAAYGVAQQKKASAEQAATQAAADNRAAVAQLRTEYAALVASGSLEGAAQKLKEINAALLGTKPAAQEAARAAADAASAIDAAFKGLGVTSSAELATLAATAKTQYDVIKNAGTTTAADIGAAFKVAAEKAIAANNGIAPSWVYAQAAAAGYRTEVDAVGRATLKSADDILAGTQAASKGWDGVTAATQRAAVAASNYAQQYARAGASMEEKYARAGASMEDKYARAGKAGGAAKKTGTGGSGSGSGGGDPMGSQWVWTRAAIIEYLSQSGLDAKLAEELSKDFVNRDGSVDYEASGAQKRWGGKYSTLAESLGKMADYYKYDQQGKFEADQRAEFLNKKTAAPAPAPAAGRASGSSGGGNTYVSNITIPGVGKASLNFSDAHSQSQAEDLIRQLAQAKGAAVR